MVWAPDLARREMVERQLRKRGISDERVLAAMEEVPRHIFVGSREDAYGDHPLPIGQGQTISQPYMVARMVELAELEPSDRALEVGAGCGYQAAIMSRLCAEVVAIEIVPELAERAQLVIEQLGYDNVQVVLGDGSQGYRARAPYDAIIVAAGAPRVPPPLAVQLADGGRLVIPVGDRFLQSLKRYIRHGDELVGQEDTPCRFVDLKGEHGWA
ncbi:MAG: protein-L-isoaspartate(D-aspartate) O-methyltransferase [Myxococcales bacterium]|nr:protein-L-isoaspartate(D-aspartate) O-methyltransferase [Myxococcales bacterium]